MQKFVLVWLLLPLFHTPVFSQIQSPTTEEEYNYGAVGYKIQLQAKLDTKAGYKLIPSEGCEENDRKIEFQKMYRDGEKQPCAVILIYTKVRNAPMYYCIPSSNANPALWEKFNKSLTTGTDNPAEQLQFFTRCMAQLMMEMTTQKQ